MLRLTGETEMSHEKADGFNTLFDTKIMKCEASVFGGTKDNCPTHLAIVAHLLQCSCNHGALKAIELAVGEVAYSKGVANAAQKNGRVIYPGSLRGYVAESESLTMISGFLLRTECCWHWQTTAAWEVPRILYAWVTDNCWMVMSSP